MFYTYEGEIVKVVDGDTIDVLVDLGFKTFSKQRLRLAGINTPETYGVKVGSEEYKKGMLAKSRVQSFCPVGTKVTIQTLKDKTGKFGRYIAFITPEGCSETLNTILVEEGLAEVREY